MAVVICVNASGVKKGFSDACPSGWTPASTTPAAGAGGATTPAANTTPRRVTVPSFTAVPMQAPNAQGWYSSPQRTYLSYDNQETAEEGFGSLPANMKNYIDAVAKFDDYRRTGASLYAQAVRAITDSGYSGAILSPFQWIQNYGRGIGFTNMDGTISDAAKSALSGGGGGGGGGGAAAPEALGADTMRRAMDALAGDLIGRTLSDKEFKRYYGAYRSDFAGNPALDTTQHGTEALQRNDDYQEYQVAAKFATAMESVIRGAA